MVSMWTTYACTSRGCGPLTVYRQMTVYLCVLYIQGLHVSYTISHSYVFGRVYSLLLAPGDYEALNTTFAIPAGSAQRYVELLIGVDYIAENSENFTVVLSNPSEGAVIVDPVTTVNIINVDGETKK